RPVDSAIDGESFEARGGGHRVQVLRPDAGVLPVLYAGQMPAQRTAGAFADLPALAEQPLERVHASRQAIDLGALGADLGPDELVHLGASFDRGRAQQNRDLAERESDRLRAL